jgi:hypothetical protein
VVGGSCNTGYSAADCYETETVLCYLVSIFSASSHTMLSLTEPRGGLGLCWSAC